MSVIVEGTRGVYLGGAASIVDASSDRELAWAEKYVTTQPDLKWILGNYVEADNANENGHIFPLDDLKEEVTTIPNKPLNMLHREHNIVGNYAAAELLYPKGEEAAAAAEPGGHPIIEALSAFYRYYFRDLYELVEIAHKQGQLYYSMETVPESVTCKGKGPDEGCGKLFAFKGRTDPSYCDHLNQPGSRKVLHKPHFTAGALIIPPVKPGWKRADITELSGLIEANLEEADRAYNQIKGEFPHLSPREWEAMMAHVLAVAQDELAETAG